MELLGIYLGITILGLLTAYFGKKWNILSESDVDFICVFTFVPFLQVTVFVVFLSKFFSKLINR